MGNFDIIQSICPALPSCLSAWAGVDAVFLDRDLDHRRRGGADASDASPQHAGNGQAAEGQHHKTCTQRGAFLHRQEASWPCGTPPEAS